MLKRNQAEFLKEVLLQLKKAKRSAEYSLEVCSAIGIKDEYSEDEKDRIEALTSKFARLSDLILKKAVRAIDVFELDDPAYSLRDIISQAETKRLIESEKKFVEIRRYRNIISHEYILGDAEAKEVFEFVLNNMTVLFDSVNRIVRYCSKFNLK